MATQQMIGASSMVSSEKYDVFLSFRGEDTRQNFTCHLYDALIREKVETFIDNNELQKGDDISPALIRAIEESHISIIIFSKDYASSKWCLKELIKILECKNDRGQIVIPVFYNINPTHVKNQTGSYQRSFAIHKQDLKLDSDKLQEWKAGLFAAANLVGFESTKYGNDSDFIKVIVKDVLQKMKHKYLFEVKDTGLVTIEKKCEEVESLLEIGSNDVRILGIWGMGGIGKTTLAKALCSKLYYQFDGYCFLENVREESKKHGLIVLRQRLFSALLEEENIRLDAAYVEPHSIMKRLSRKKVFIVLDNMATSQQIEYLIINNNFLGPGSRVIVTSRDKQILKHVHGIYEVKKLNKHDSLQLFCLNAFKEKHPKIGYTKLSKSASSYCKGNPLALKVLGARLGSRSKIAWESDFKKLQKIPDVEIHNVLKLSYDDLDHTQKDIFLDIACFFEGKYRDHVTSVLEACGFFATVGIEVLLNKALITIANHDDYDAIEMHDLIQEMGREIVNQESIKNPGKRSRLWKAEEVADVLKKKKGTKVVEGITFNCTDVEDLFLSFDCFKRMTSLRYLEIYDVNISHKYGENIPDEYCHIYLPDGLGWLSDKLRFLHWDVFPLAYLPSNFNAEMLVELCMVCSKLKRLWDGVQNLGHLKKIKLDYSRDLIEMPDLSRATNLEILCLNYCESLRELHSSILSLSKIKIIGLRDCVMIESLKSNIHSKSLSELDCSGCSSLVKFSVTSEEMTGLYLGRTAIRELPSSIWRNNKVEHLNLGKCDKLSIVGKKLSNDPLGIAGSLIRTLNLSKCTQINALNLFYLLDGIQSSLERLYLNGLSNLETIPHNIKKHSKLNNLELNDCRKLVSSLTDLTPFLHHLSAANCTLLETDSIQQLLLENNLQSILSDDRGSATTFMFMPGDQVPAKFDFQNREDSISIPIIPKSNLCGFICCVILSEGFLLRKGSIDGSLHCIIYEGGQVVSNSYKYDTYDGTLISDHVLLFWSECKSQNDECTMSFEFRRYSIYRPQDRIKACGVLPVYAFDPRAIGGDVGGFRNENEDDNELQPVTPKKRRRLQ